MRVQREEGDSVPMRGEARRNDVPQINVYVPLSDDSTPGQFAFAAYRGGELTYAGPLEVELSTN